MKPQNVFLPFEAEIVATEQMTELEQRFTLRPKKRDFEFQPGQMLEVSVFGYGEIPIGLASSPTRGNTFDIVVRTVGRVSTAINLKQKGDTLHLRGPLGKGFRTEDLCDQDVLIVAGGIGLAPTRSLIQYILDRRDEFRRFVLLYGARTPKDQLFKADLEEWRMSDAVELHESVDRAEPGWSGNTGVITTLFKKVTLSPTTRVVICGPPIMYKFVILELMKLGVPSNQISIDLERRMKCGIGKCGHCQMNDKYVCTDGPVFKYGDVLSLEETFG